MFLCACMYTCTECVIIMLHMRFTFLSYIAQLIQLSTQIGLPLDPVYTFKGVRGLIAELQKNPGRFKGKRILFIYTGN